MNRLLAYVLLALIPFAVMAQDSRPPITNADVVSMTKSGVGEQTIILAIQQGHTAFDTSPQALIELKKAGVTDGVLNLMLAASKGQQTAAAQEARPSQSVAAEATKDTSVGYIDCGSLRVGGIPLWDGEPGTAISEVNCGEQVRVLEQDHEWDRVRTGTDNVGYVKQESVSPTPTSPKDVRPFTGDAAPPPSSQPGPQPPSQAPQLAEGLRIRVLQEKSVPYVQQSGGGISTSCNISGSANTSITATNAGNFTFGNATTTSELQMKCNSYDTTIRWPHVLNAMLVEASDGNAYIIACDRAWRWSKCVPLRAGETFNARHTSKGMAVQAFNEKGKESEPTYTVLQSKALH